MSMASFDRASPPWTWCRALLAIWALILELKFYIVSSSLLWEQVPLGRPTTQSSSCSLARASVMTASL